LDQVKNMTHYHLPVCISGTKGSSSFVQLLATIGDEHERIVAGLLAEVQTLKKELCGRESEINHASTPSHIGPPYEEPPLMTPCTDTEPLDEKQEEISEPDKLQQVEDHQGGLPSEASRSISPRWRSLVARNRFLTSAPGDKLDIEDVEHTFEIAGKLSIRRRVSGGLSSDISFFVGEVSGTMKGWVQNSVFELIVAGLIVINTLVMAIETQYLGLKVGHELEFRGMNESSHELWGPSAESAFLAMERIFTVIFTCEVTIRIVLFRCDFLRSPFNWLDIVIILAGLADWILHGVWAIPNATLARLIRLLKVSRGIRIIRMSKILDSLHLLLKCVSSSVATLLWTFGLLAVIQCVAAMAFSHSVRNYLQDSSKPLEERRQVYSYYGTFTRSMLTMFEIMLANWGPACRVLVDNVHESFSFVFVAYRCCAGFAVLNVISAVFIQQTLKVAHNDKEVMISQKQRAQEDYVRKLKALFFQLDTSGDGLVSWDEFQQMLTDVRLKAWLNALEIEPTDMEEFFHILDDGDGELTIDEFVLGISRLRGFAKAIDMAHLMALVKRIDTKVEKVINPHAKTKRAQTVRSFTSSRSGFGYDLVLRSPMAVSSSSLAVVPAAEPAVVLPHCVT